MIPLGGMKHSRVRGEVRQPLEVVADAVTWKISLPLIFEETNALKLQIIMPKIIHSWPGNL